MSEINVQLKDGAAVPMPASSTVAEALKKLDRDVAKQALAARVNGREVDLAAQLDRLPSTTVTPSRIEPVVAADAGRSRGAASLDRAFAGCGSAGSLSRNQTGNRSGAAGRSALRILSTT